MNNKNDILESEKILHILKEIESNPYLTQRYLSRKYLMSLGKINFLIKSLIAKGIVEIRNFSESKNKLRYMYLLTPHGIKTKLQLTHKFLVWKINQYKKLKHEIEHFKKELSEDTNGSQEAGKREAESSLA